MPTGGAPGRGIVIDSNPTIIVSATVGAPLAKQIQDAIVAENEKMIGQLQAHVVQKGLESTERRYPLQARRK